MADPLRHRQTKGAATDMVDLRPPRHIPTLPNLRLPNRVREGPEAAHRTFRVGYDSRSTPIWR